MAKKADLEQAYNDYRQSCGVVARFEAAFALHDAIRTAEASLPLLHSAITFQRRFLKAEEPTAPTLDALLRYAPPLFLRSTLDAVQAWYAGGTKAERSAVPDVPPRLENARRVLDRAVELWSVLAAGPDARLRLDGRHASDPEIVTAWLNLGAVANTVVAPSECARVSDPRRVARGKCGNCGHVLALPLARLLEPFPCPACRRPSHFVITGRLA